MYWQLRPGDPHAAPTVGAVSPQPGVAPTVAHFSVEPSGAHSACPCGYVQMSPLVVQVVGYPACRMSDQVAGQAGSFDARPVEESGTVAALASGPPQWPPK